MMRAKLSPPNNIPAPVIVAGMNAHIESILRQEDDVENCHFRNEKLDYAPAVSETVNFRNCIFEKCIFESHLYKAINFIDVKFINSDLSNASFDKSSFTRVSFTECKAMGTIFTHATLGNVKVHKSIFRFASFTAAKASHVLFEESDLSCAVLEQCKLKSVYFWNCSLEMAEFSFIPLKDIDFTSCKIRGIRADPRDWRGAIIASHQAVDLAVLLGVIIEDPLPKDHDSGA